GPRPGMVRMADLTRAPRGPVAGGGRSGLQRVLNTTSMALGLPHGFARADAVARGRPPRRPLHRRRRPPTPDPRARGDRRVRHGLGGLATRIGPETGSALKAAFPEGEHNPVARTFRLKGPDDDGPKLGRVVVVTAGTSDLPVAEEARVTAEAWGCDVSLVVDV